jgi:drug/metabolite transporter (DMT)-like permease
VDSTDMHSSNSPVATGTASHWLVHLKLVGMAALWGASWPSGRVLAQALPPLTASAWRFGIALVLLLVWLHARAGVSRVRSLSSRQWFGLAAAGAVGVFGYAAFFMLGLAHVPAGRAALVVTSNPVLTALIAAWLFGERLDWKIGAGMALATLGAAVVLTHGRPWLLLTGGIGFGELLLLGCVLMWVAYTLMGRRLLAGIDALCTTTVTAAFGLVLLLVTALLLEGPGALAAPLHAGAQVWSALAFLAIGATVLAYAWYFEGVAVLGAGAAAGYISLVPVFGVLFSALWLGEQVDLSILLGGVLAVGGMAVMNLARR